MTRIQVSPKGITLAEEEDVLRLISNSGILYIDNSDMVGFKHHSFLEYFASVQIFYVNHNYEQLIKNFNDVNWQNAAIFYAGFSKDMPWFVEKLINGMPNENLRDWLINVGGMGYLSQALYMTDVEDRIKLISKSLENTVVAFRRLKDLTGELGPYHKMPLHIIGAILVFWFNMNFRSVTLAHCLERLYEDYLRSNANSLGAGNFEIAFKLFLIATTLASEYLNQYEKLNDLIERDCFLKDPLLIVLGDMFLDIQEVEKDDVSDEKRKKINNEIKRFKKLLVNITREPAYRFGEDYKKVNRRIESPK